MENMSNGTSWQQHISAERKPSDGRYGYWDLNDKTFKLHRSFYGYSKCLHGVFLGNRQFGIKDAGNNLCLIIRPTHQALLYTPVKTYPVYRINQF